MMAQAQMEKGEPQAGQDACPDMRPAPAGSPSESKDGKCCKSKSLCCSNFVVPHAPVPSFPLLSPASIPPEQSQFLQSGFSSYIPPVLDPPPRY